jgi:hypothetical protein
MHRRVSKGGAKKTKIAWITLATGKQFASTALNWFKSSQQFFCSDSDRFDVHYMVLTDEATRDEFVRSDVEIDRIFLWTGVKKVQ